MPADPAPFPSQNALRLPRTIDGRYRLLTPLGEGGMSTVYEAQHLYTGRRVAVKLLLPTAAEDPDVVRRFLEEARSTSRVSHPYCVDILDMGQEHDGTLYLVQELLTGMDLRRYLQQQGRLQPDEALGIALPIIEALAAAHAHGVVHRDVKPSNIFLVTAAAGNDSPRIPKLIDFGIAKMLELEDSGLGQTRTGRALGTPTHMSPEQLRGTKPLDGRTDVWSMGVVLYEMLAGCCPFSAPNPHMLAVRILTEPAERIETHVPTLPAPLAAVIHHALEPDRDRRLRSMDALRTALLSCLGEDGSTATVLMPAPHPLLTAAPLPAPAPMPLSRDGATSVVGPKAVPPAVRPLANAEAATVLGRTHRTEADTPGDDDLAPATTERRRNLVIGLVLGLVLGGGWLWLRGSTTQLPPPAHPQALPPATPDEPAPRAAPAPRIAPSITPATIPVPGVQPPPQPMTTIALPVTPQQPRPVRSTRERASRARPVPPEPLPRAPAVPAPRAIPQGTNGAPIFE